MPGLVPGIHVYRQRKQDVDGRDKPGHDGWVNYYFKHCHGKLRQIKPEQLATTG
jgi:hypothetical protein